jgi:predicted dithiol-disulfide oxidoreductase (DUF899 family)
MNNAIVSRQEWLTAREALFAKERAMTHACAAHLPAPEWEEAGDHAGGL